MRVFETIKTMLQTFEGTIDNGQIIWNDPDNAPRNAKVLVTVLQLEKRPIKTENRLNVSVVC